MHKLRLRTRSTPTQQQAAEGSSNINGSNGNSNISNGLVKGKGKQQEQASSSTSAKRGLKASIRHIGADSTRGRPSPSSPPASINAQRAAAAIAAGNDTSTSSSSRPQLTLGTGGNDFRTSLILPALTRRFTLLRSKDGSLVPLDQMQAHLRTQRENGRLTESEEELVLNQYRMQTIYEASQPPDLTSNGNVNGYHQFIPSSSLNGHLETLQEEETASVYTESLRQSHEQSRSPHVANKGGFGGGGSHGVYNQYQYSSSNSPGPSPVTAYSNSFSGHASPSISMPMLASSSSASSSTSTPTPVSTGFASSSAAEFYAARDAVMRGNGLFGGGGLERDVISKMNSSNNLAASASSSSGATGNESGPSTGTGEPVSALRKSRIKRYTNHTTTAAASETSSVHSEGSGGRSSSVTSPISPRSGYRLPPPVPKIHKPQEEEYDPYRPKDSDDGHEQMISRSSNDEHFTTLTGTNATSTLPGFLDQPMSKKQIKRISRALEDIEAELTKTYSFVDLPPDALKASRSPEQLFQHTSPSQRSGHFSSHPQEEQEEELVDRNDGIHQNGTHRYDQYQDFDFSPSEDEAGYGSSSYGFPNDGERTFHSSTSGSNSSEYHHQHSARAPFVYDDTDEIDPPLARLPSQQELDAKLHTLGEEEEEAIDNGSGYAEAYQRSDKPEIQLEGVTPPETYIHSPSNLYDGVHFGGSEQGSSRPPSSTADQSVSTAVPGTERQSATHSTSTLDGGMNGISSQLAVHMTHPGHLSVASDLSKAASSPGLPYLQATPSPPVQMAEFPPLPPSHSSASSLSSASAHMQPSPSTNTIASTTSSRSNVSSRQQISGLSGGVSIALPRRLQDEPSPAHSRSNSSSSSLNPPKSPPPACSLPPLPNSPSSHSLPSLSQRSLEQQQQQHQHQQSLHSAMSSIDSMVQVANPQTRSAHDKDALNHDNDTEAIGFPIYSENTLHPVPNGQRSSAANEGDETTRVRADSEVDSENGRRYSNASAGSSWRGGPVGKRTFSTSTADFDLSMLPVSPSKATHRMKGIEEDEDEEEAAQRAADQEDEQRRVLQYLQETAPGLDLQDLRAIHERLVQGALQHGSSANGVDQETRLPSVVAAHRDQTSTAFASDLFAPDVTAGDRSPAMLSDVGPSSYPYNRLSADQSNLFALGSPFADQGVFDKTHESSHGHPESTEPQNMQTPVFNSLDEEQYAKQLDFSRTTDGHPGTTDHDKAQLQSSQSSHGSASRRKAVPASPGTDNESALLRNPSRNQTMQSDLRVAPPALPSSLEDMEAPLPPATLRPKQTRASNSTPSMLIRHVQLQATEATAALKNSYPPPPLSPDDALRRVANNPARRNVSHRKSAKNLRIGSPLLVSSSANLESMPTIDTQPQRQSAQQSRSSSSPEINRKPSLAGLRFRMRLKNSKNGHDASEDQYVPSSADSYGVSGGVASPMSPSHHMRGGENTSTEEQSPASGIRQLVSKLRRRKTSNEVPAKLLPDPLILQSPHFSSPKQEHGQYVDARDGFDQSNELAITKSPGAQGQFVSAQKNEMLADVTPLRVPGSASATASAYSRQQNLRTPTHSPSLSLSVQDGGTGQDRTSAASLDSMRKLFEAATALGLDADKVNELVNAAGFSHSSSDLPAEQRIVRSTVILAPTDDSYFPSTPHVDAESVGMMTRSASTSSLRRSRSQKSQRARKASEASNELSSPGHEAHRRATIDTQSESSSQYGRRSVHDRVPTPPPGKKEHRRQKSETLARENPLPNSSHMGVTAGHSEASENHPYQYHLASAQGTDAYVHPASDNYNDVEELGLPAPPFGRSNKGSRASVMSSKTTGSYDARSIYGLYADEEEEVPPTPGIKDMNMILASGRIPASTGSGQRASLLLAPGVSAKRLSTASRNSRIELAEFANGDIAFNIVQSLRRGPGLGDGDRGTFYPLNLHNRQNSDNSFEEELQSLAVAANTSPEADPLKLLIKRHMNDQAQNGKSDQQQMEVVAELQRLAARTNLKQSSSSAGTAASAFEVYEASDESQVASLIEELTKGLDEGQFNLSRSGTISNSSKGKGRAVTNDGISQTAGQTVNGAPSSPGAGLVRTPSKIRRQPPPTI